MKTQIVIKSEDERLVYGEVYSPLLVDTDDETMTAEEIRKMAHRFVMEGRVAKIDVSHDQEESGCLVVESFIARDSDPDGFINGAWVLGVKVLNDKIWEAVKKGELNGFSFFGEVGKVAAEVEVEQARKIIGMTELSKEDGLLPPHDHPIVIKFDGNGKVIPTETEKVFDHTHPVLRSTATELVMDHAHRLIVIENAAQNN